MKTKDVHYLSVLIILYLILLFILSGCGQGQSAAEVIVEEPTWQELYDAGIKSANAENYEEAISNLEAAIELDPKQPDAYSALADAYLAIDDTEKAIATLQRGYDATGHKPLEIRLKELTGTPKPKYLVDYLGMTVNEIAELWGEDYEEQDGLFMGGSKGIYYKDNRIHVVFYFDDPMDQGVKSGNERINYITASSYRGLAAENLPCDTTYDELKSSGLSGEFDQYEDSDISAAYIFQISNDVTVMYEWNYNDDPFTKKPMVSVYKSGLGAEEEQEEPPQETLSQEKDTFKQAAGEGISLSEFLGTWHTGDEADGMPLCELDVLSVNDDGVVFDVSWYRVGGYENVQTYYFLKETDITSDQIMLYYTTDDGAGGNLIFENGRITLSIAGTPYSDGEYEFESRGERMF